MSTKSLRVEIAVLIFLSSISWPDAPYPGLRCQAEQSRVVRKVIQKKFFPILERYKASLPLDCPFHSGRDLYGRRREGPELEGDAPGLVCWICGLAFGDERHLQHHYQHEHAESLILQEGAICLADYCAVMRCNVLLANEWLSGLNASQSTSSATTSSSSSSTSSAHKSQEGATTRFQRQHSAWNEERESEGKTAAREAYRDREEAKKGRCDAAQLQGLQRKCQIIIRSCIAGLLLSLSPKDFQEIEEDMNRAVCSFLTCEKFWEDSLIEEPRYPLGFFLAVLTMLGIGMIICYYIVWVVFDSGELYGREECYEVYVLYSERVVDTKPNAHKCDAKRRMVKSWEDKNKCDYPMVK